MRTHDQTGKDKTQTSHVSECSHNPTRRLAGVPACSEAQEVCNEWIRGWLNA